MSATKRETATQIIRYLRIELKEMEMELKDNGLPPEPGQIKALLAQGESLLDLVEGVKKKPKEKH